MFKKSNTYYKNYPITPSSYTLFNKTNYYQKFPTPTIKKKHSKKISYSNFFISKKSNYKKQYSNYKLSNKENEINLNNSQYQNEYSIYSEEIFNNNKNESYINENKEKNEIKLAKKDSLDATDESTICLSYGSFNENEINDNDNLNKKIQNLNLNSNEINETIFFEENKKNIQDNQNLNEDYNQFLNYNSQNIIEKKDSNENLKNKNLNLNRETPNKYNLNNNLNININNNNRCIIPNNKSSNNKYNKFNLNINNIIQSQNRILENTEILCVNVKLSNDKIVVFKLRRYDDLFNTVKLFCEINSIKEDLIKPIIIKSLEALNNIYKIYNWKMSKDDINQLNLINNYEQF